MRPPFNLEAVERATLDQISKGHRVFQTHRYADHDADHVALLLAALAPKEHALILDAGCGIGEVSRLMAASRPDLNFILANISPYQLSLCPVGPQFHAILADCHQLPSDDASIDCVMFSSALCQMDIGVALREAWRVLKHEGVLLVNDMAHHDGYQAQIEEILAARVLGADSLLDHIEEAGFILEWFGTPENNADHFIDLAGQIGLEKDVRGLYPIIIRAFAQKG